MCAAALRQPMSSLHCNNYSSYAPSCPSPLGAHTTNIPPRYSYPTWPSLKANGAMPADTILSENQMDHAPAFSVRSVGSGVKTDNPAEPNQLTRRPTAYGQRYISRISNPLSNIFRSGSSPSSSLPVRNAKRRDAFLNRVKRDRDAERFEARGEQLMMMEYLSEEKKWKAAMQKDADRLFQQYNKYGAEEEQEGAMSDVDQYVLEEYLSEDQELDRVLIENQSGFQSPNFSPIRAVAISPHSDRSSIYSDEEYDDIFMDLLSQDKKTWQPQPSQEMDMSGD